MSGGGRLWPGQATQRAVLGEKGVMQPWKPDEDKRQARRIGKTQEEVCELGCVLARISIQGMLGVDPASGKTNRQRLTEEMADVLAQIRCNVSVFEISWCEVEARAREKQKQMVAWEAHFERGAS